MKCKLRGCTSKSRSKGLCIKHYTRLWRHGSVDAVNGYIKDVKHDRTIRFRYTVLGKSIRLISRELGISRHSVANAVRFK